MAERHISEVTVRAMLLRARVIHASSVDGRFVVTTTRIGQKWRVILEPDEALGCVVVVTVYSEGGP